MGEKASVLSPIGQIRLNLLFVLLVPRIFFSISSSIANIADTNRVGKLLVLTMGIFVVTAAIVVSTCSPSQGFSAWILPFSWYKKNLNKQEEAKI